MVQVLVLTTVVALGVILHSIETHGFKVSSNNALGCQGKNLKGTACGTAFGDQSRIRVISVTVITSSNIPDIINNTARSDFGCAAAQECRRTIHMLSDQGISADYRHLYQYIAHRCHGRIECLEVNLPEYWDLIDNTKGTCGNGTIQYFSGVIVDIECWSDQEAITLPPPPSTTPRTRPTTPTTTTAFPVFIPIYQPQLQPPEKVILGVAIGLALAILLVLLIVLYCCERYRHHKRFGKLLRMLGAPQAQEDAFDELDYGKKEAWRDETQNLDALGEYTGVKPDEFLTLDKRTMESTGQILYDTPTGTMQKGNSCSTIDRLDRVRGAPLLKPTNNHQGPIDYDTEENREIERRMAAALNYEIESE